MTEQTPTPTPDPGSPCAARIAWALFALFLVANVAINQAGWPAKSASDASVVAPGLDAFTMSSKMFVKLSAALPITDRQRSKFMTEIDKAAGTPVERFRAAIVAGELFGPEAALERLDKIEADDTKTPIEGLADDVAAQRKLLAGESPEESETRRLVQRHGWFARLALTRTLPADNPERHAVVRGGLALTILFVLAGGAFVIACVVGLVLFILATTRLAGGYLRFRFEPPAPGGSVYLELAAVLLGAYLLTHLPVSIIATQSTLPDWFTAAKFVVQWLLVGVLAYPLLRGQSLPQVAAALGWRAPRGVWREIGAGIIGYFAGFPLFALAAAMTYLILLLRGPGAPKPVNPVADLIAVSGPLELFLLGTLVLIWAPLVEESVFRGALYRHLRSRTGVVIAALATGLFFGVMHGYSYYLLLPVITLGVIFALIREWRGSLVGCMTAHAMHNGVVLAFATAIFWLLRD